MSKRLAVLLAAAGMAAVVLALAGMAWAQGGDPGGGGGIGDTTAPRVVKIVPFDGRRGFDRDANLKAKFSERMRPASVTAPDHFYVLRYEVWQGGGATGGGTPGGNGVITYNAKTKTATYNHNGRLDANQRYVAVVEGAADTDSLEVEDRAGNPMTKDRIWHFRTGAQ